MADSISCPSCRRLLQVSEARRGQQVQCSACGQVFTSEPPMGTQDAPATPVFADPTAVQTAPPVSPARSPRRARYELDDDDYDDDARPDFRSRKRFVQGGGLAVAVLALLGIMTAFYGLMLVSDYLEYELLKRVVRGEFIAPNQLDANDLRQQLLSIVYLLLLIPTAIVYLVWFHRAYTNLEALGADDLRHKPAWAVGSWFVPILNLFRPVQIAQEIWRGSDPDQAAAREGGKPTPGNSGLIGLWWAFWLISNVASNIAFQMSATAKTAQVQVSAAWVSMLASALCIVAGLLALAVVAAIERRQRACARVARGEWDEEDGDY